MTSITALIRYVARGRAQVFERALRLSQFLHHVRQNVIDWDKHTIVGTSTKLEKKYLRLTSVRSPRLAVHSTRAL
jgi:hypothetical protein